MHVCTSVCVDVRVLDLAAYLELFLFHKHETRSDYVHQAVEMMVVFLQGSFVEVKLPCMATP
jgi:hypothetical protein